MVVAVVVVVVVVHATVILFRLFFFKPVCTSCILVSIKFDKLGGPGVSPLANNRPIQARI